MTTIPMNRTGIKFIVASFDLFFGQPEGKACVCPLPFALDSIV